MRTVLTVLSLALVPSLVFADHVKHSLEVYTAQELQAETDMVEKMSKEIIAPISTKTQKRDQHPKDNGCVDGVRVEVRADLPKDLRVGIFQPGAVYEAVVRSSSAKSDPNHDDRIPSGQGMFLKVLLTGKHEALQKQVDLLQPWQKHFKSVDKKYYLSQDFITITEGRGPEPKPGEPNPFVEDFFADKPADYNDFFQAQKLGGAFAEEVVEQIVKQRLAPDVIVEKWLAIAKKYPLKPERIESVKEAILSTKTFPMKSIGDLGQEIFAASYLFDAKGNLKRPLEAMVLKKVGAIATTDPLTESYNSFTASAFGEDNAVKYNIHPETEAGETVAFPSDVNRDDKNYLREVIKSRLRSGGARYTLSVAFYDTKTEPNIIENASRPWKFKPVAKATNRWERRGYVPLATIIFPKKAAGEELMDAKVCENLPSSPGRGLAAHRSVGGVQRARDIIYPLVQNARMQAKGEEELPGDL